MSRSRRERAVLTRVFQDVSVFSGFPSFFGNPGFRAGRSARCARGVRAGSGAAQPARSQSACTQPACRAWRGPRVSADPRGMCDGVLSARCAVRYVPLRYHLRYTPLRPALGPDPRDPAHRPAAGLHPPPDPPARPALKVARCGGLPLIRCGAGARIERCIAVYSAASAHGHWPWQR